APTQRCFDSGTAKDQLVRCAPALKIAGGKTEALEPLHKVGRKHLPLAVEHVAAQPGGFAAAQAQGADVIELLLELAGIDQLGQPNRGRTVDNAEGAHRVLGPAVKGLRPEQPVKIDI